MSAWTARRRSMLAAAYVLGTLRGPARRAFSRRLRRDPALAAAVHWWERQFHRLNGGFRPETPPPAVWAAISRDLVTATPARNVPAASGGRVPPVLTATRSRPQVHGVSRGWRALALAASLVAMVLGGLLVRETRQVPPATPVVAEATATYVGALSADGGRWLVSVPLHGGRMRVRVEGAPRLTQDQDAELWWIGADGTPKSLGVLPVRGELERVVAALPPGESPVLAVSLEPPGGSPEAGPTGPVVATFNAIRSL